MIMIFALKEDHEYKKTFDSKVICTTCTSMEGSCGYYFHIACGCILTIPQYRRFRTGQYHTIWFWRTSIDLRSIQAFYVLC